MKQSWKLLLLLALAGSGLSGSCPETQPLCFNLKGKQNALIFHSWEYQERRGGRRGQGKALSFPTTCWVIKYLSLILCKLLCLVGTGRDRENAPFGVDIMCCINCSYSFPFPLTFPSAQLPSERREQKGQARALPRSLALTLSCPEGVRGGQ